jgi:L-aminopeptidase/D-esterase-like protein
MKTGIGTAAIVLPNGLVVAALVAVNAVGDIIDPATGKVVAGVRNPDGSFADARILVRSGTLGRRDPDFDRKKPGADTAPRPGENTTIGVVATNAALTKAEATKMAQMAHDGYARAISPVHTPGDGDTIFALATGTLGGEANASLVGALAAEVMADAIVRAATQATGLPGIPSVRDVRK